MLEVQTQSYENNEAQKNQNETNDYEAIYNKLDSDLENSHNKIDAAIDNIMMEQFENNEDMDTNKAVKTLIEKIAMKTQKQPKEIQKILIRSGNKTIQESGIALLKFEQVTVGDTTITNIDAQIAGWDRNTILAKLAPQIISDQVLNNDGFKKLGRNERLSAKKIINGKKLVAMEVQGIMTKYAAYVKGTMTQEDFSSDIDNKNEAFKQKYNVQDFIKKDVLIDKEFDLDQKAIDKNLKSKMRSLIDLLRSADTKSLSYYNNLKEINKINKQLNNNPALQQKIYNRMVWFTVETKGAKGVGYESVKDIAKQLRHMDNVTLNERETLMQYYSLSDNLGQANNQSNYILKELSFKKTEGLSKPEKKMLNNAMEFSKNYSNRTVTAEEIAKALSGE